jgi:tetratricopeptide (TPR) repeat protein
MKLFRIFFILAIYNSIFADDLYDSYVLESKGKYSEALVLVEKLSKSEPNEYLFQIRSAWLSYLNAEYTKSAEYYRKAQVLTPDSIEPKLGLIKVFSALGQFKNVETTCRAILKQDPKNYISRTNLAYSLYQAGNFKEARKIYESVLVDYPADLEMILGQGWSFLKEGEKQKSKESFSRALKISPQNPRAQEGLWYAGK